jgi:nicotinate-nucleotide--dimethylbenzimidazole phosphoribosyltransferase
MRQPVSSRVDRAILDHCRAAHVSAEAGHRLLLRELGLHPLLDLDMRLGEASGAAVAILLLRAALACHNGMATFSEAGVAGADPCCLFDEQRKRITPG